MIKQAVSKKFINYIQFCLDKENISTRELSEKLEKSSAYISQVLTQKIRTITYENAFSILKEFMPGNDSVIESMLIEQFGIEPDEIIESRLKIDEENETETVKRMKVCESIITNINNNLKRKMFEEKDVEKLLILQEYSKMDFNDRNLGELLDEVARIYKKANEEDYNKLLKIINN
jgi:hypothetical protein